MPPTMVDVLETFERPSPFFAAVPVVNTPDDEDDEDEFDDDDDDDDIDDEDDDLDDE